MYLYLNKYLRDVKKCLQKRRGEIIEAQLGATEENSRVLLWKGIAMVNNNNNNNAYEG